MKQATTMEHAERVGTRGYKASGRNAVIVHEKVCGILSGGELCEDSDGGETHYCSILLDSGHDVLVCGDVARVAEWLGINTDL